jgi:hypothetical protein
MDGIDMAAVRKESTNSTQLTGEDFLKASLQVIHEEPNSLDEMALPSLFSDDGESVKMEDGTSSVGSKSFAKYSENGGVLDEDKFSLPASDQDQEKVSDAGGVGTPRSVGEVSETESAKFRKEF